MEAKIEIIILEIRIKTFLIYIIFVIYFLCICI